MKIIRPDWRDYVKREAKASVKALLLLPVMVVAVTVVLYSPGILDVLRWWSHSYSTCVVLKTELSRENRRVRSLIDVVVIRWQCARWASSR